MKRQLTRKTIFLSIVGATLLVVVAGLVLALVVGHVRTPNSDAIVKVFKPVPFDLYTHCGINELKANGRYFQRVGGILVDGSRTPSGLGNPPTGWGNPVQHGTLTITSDIAVFRDKEGHVETFKVRSLATGFLNMCD